MRNIRSALWAYYPTLATRVQGARAACPRRGRDALDPGRKVGVALLVLWGFALVLTTLAHAQRDADSLHVVGETIVTGSRLAIPRANAIATKTPLPLRKTPLSVGIVPQALIEAQDGATLGDALANVSGVGVHTNFGVHDLFYLRGFDSLANGLVLSDGAPEPEATFYQLYNVDRVEALKGPGAFLYGGNPLSGTINLVRKRPLPASSFAQVNASVGSFSTYRATVDVGRPGWRVNALWQDAEGYRDGKNCSILAVNPTLRLDLGTRSTLHLDFEYLTSEHRSDSGLPIVNGALPDVPRTRSYQSPFDLSTQTIQRGRADWEWRLAPNFTVRDKLYYTRLDWPSQGTLFNGAFPNAAGSLDLARTLLDLDDQQRIVGNQLEGLLALHTGGIEHQLLFGVEIAHHSDDFTLDVALLSQVDLFTLTATLPPSLPSSMSADSLRVPLPDEATAGQTAAQLLAPYFIDRIIVSPHFELLLGGRFDRIDYRDDLTATQRDYRQVSPMLGAVFAPSQTLSLYANAGRAFAAPSAQVVGDRDPEESTQYEIGVKAALLNGHLNLNGAVFTLDKERIAIPDDNGITQQLGDQRARGLELELAVRRPTWYAQGTYAYLDAELTRFSESVFVPTDEGFVPQTFDRTGNAPAFAPEHLATLWAARDLGEHFTLTAGLRYVGSQFVAEDNVYEIDGALTLDCGLTYRRGPGLLRLNLKNATGREYETRGFGSTSVIPAAPFSFKATLGYSL